jgi:hypothetical protein
MYINRVSSLSQIMLLFQAQMLVVIVNFVLSLLCLIVVNMKKLESYAKHIGNSGLNVAIVAIYIGITFFHVIPQGFQVLLESNNAVFQNISGLCFGIGFMVSMIVYRGTRSLKKTQNKLDSPPVLKAQKKYPPYYDPTTFCHPNNYTEMDLHSGPLTIDPSLHYPQYEWNNVSTLHCHPVYAVTQLENALASTYPFMPQKQELVLQPYLIPRYIETEPQVLGPVMHSKSEIDDEHHVVLSDSYEGFLYLFIFHSMFLGVALSTVQTVHQVALISPAITICQTLQFLSLVLILKQAAGKRLLAAFSLHVFPILVITLIFIQQSGVAKESWKNTLEYILSIFLLFGSGYLLFWCATYLHHTVQKTRTNISITFFVLVCMYVLSLFEKAR